MADLSSGGSHFTELMEVLLQGQAICEHRFPALHRILADSEQDSASDDTRDRRNAEAILESMGRRLTQTAGTYYATYTGYNDIVEGAFRERFERYYKHAKPLLEFLDILRESNPSQDWPTPGDRFVFASVLDAVVASTKLNEQLMGAVSSLSQSAAPTPDSALRTLMRRLSEYGYIAATDKQDQHYVLTGELALFNQWQEFVAELEGVDLDSDNKDSGVGTAQVDLL